MSDDYDFDVEDKKTKGARVKTLAEHLLPPALTYVVRKGLLGFVLTLVFLARAVSKVYGFEFSASVSDRKEWSWNLRSKVPRYTAKVEKKQD